MTYPKDVYIHVLSNNNLSESGLSVSQQRARNIIESNIGKTINVEEVSGGLVHNVYKVTGERQNVIIKIRGNNYSALPHITINPRDIRYEHRAIQLLSSIELSTFPQLLGFDEELSMIVMTDVMPDGRTLADRLNGKEITQLDMEKLGKTVASIHRKLEPLQGSTRDGKDEDIYNLDLFYRLGFRDHPVLNETVRQLKQLPRQFILADLSPKNIGQGKNEQITICDFDSFFRGNALYALAFLTGHILIHNLDDFNNAVQLVSGLLDGYKRELPQIDSNSLLFKKVTLGAVLYRLSNPVIPYKLALSEDEKSQKADVAFTLLNSESLSWIDIVHKITA